MKIELKNLKIANHLSEETTAYSATIYVDGKAAFHTSNEGRGGCDRIHRVSGSDGPTVAEINSWLADNVAPSGPFQADPAQRQPWDTGSLCDLELLVSRMMALDEAGKALKRLLRKHVVTLGSDDKAYQYKAEPNDAAIATIRKGKADETVVNGADDSIRDRAIRILAQEPDYAEEVYARQRRGDLTKADAQWLLAQERRAARPCPDLQPHLEEVIAAADARLAAYQQTRETAAQH